MSRLSPFGGLQELRPDVTRILIVMVNAYLLGQPRQPWVLVDAGLQGSASTIADLAEARQGRPPEAIVLTHGHFDHVGGLAPLLERWNVPVYAHPLELPYLSGQSAYPPADPTASLGMMALASPLYPPGPFDFRPQLRPLPADGSVPGAPGWRWLATPGHSPGHVSLWREEDRTLIAGDAFVTTAQESGFSALAQFPTEVRRPPAYYTPDWDAAHASVELLAALSPELAATGHGTPMWGEVMREELRLLAQNFSVVGRPQHGRYTLQSAVTDLEGVRELPPQVEFPPEHTRALGGVAAALALGTVLLRRRH